MRLDNSAWIFWKKLLQAHDIYVELKNSIADEKLPKRKNLLLHLQQDLHAIPLMEAAKREALSHNLEDFNDQQLELKQEQEQLNQQQQALSKVTEIKANIVEQEKRIGSTQHPKHTLSNKKSTNWHTQKTPCC